MLSSNSLFHWTNKEALKGILANNFTVKYNYEELWWESTKQNDSSMIQIPSLVPMVCFCDIPLSEISNSEIIKNNGVYGKYGLGLRKEWGLKNGLNPIIYMEKKSNISKDFIKYYFIKTKTRQKGNEMTDRLFGQFLSHMKNHKGDFVNKKRKPIKDYNYYNEREWRYVPPIEDARRFAVTSKNYKAQIEQANSKISDLKLYFNPDDISYIIIKNDSEIDEFIKYLKDVKGGRYSPQMVQKLTTRIITDYQIKNDF